MDLDTFMTTLYVWIDDWYKKQMAAQIKRHHGPEAKMSDSEVLTVALAGQWRKGVPWQSERAVVRYMQKQGRQWFPTMLSHSRYNERVRDLWAVFVKIQQALAHELGETTAAYQVVDCVPLPSCSNAQALKHGHWLWWGTRGYGGTHGGWYWGDQAVVSVTPQYVITGWLIGPANTDDRQMLQALLSQRQGGYACLTPQPWRPWRRLSAPAFIGPLLAAGNPAPAACYVADKGFNGFLWQQLWYSQYDVSVLTAPSRHAQHVQWPSSWAKWLRSLRQVVETTFAVLDDVFDLSALSAHSRWGQQTRFALATAAFNWGIWLNRQLGRPALAHATLLS